MTNTICGHDRDALIMALEDLAHLDNDTVAGLARLPEALPVWRNAVLDLIDPAKLAAMIAERGRELDLSIAAYVGAWKWKGTYQTEWAVMPTWGNIGTLTFEHITFLRGGEFTMPQARTILLQWLNLPDCAREEAEQVLRGNHADPDELLNTIPAREYPEPRHIDPSPET